MEWGHLPVAGGIYDQHPQLIERWSFIFTEQGKYEAEKRANEERKQKASTGGPKGSRGRGARR